MSSKNIHVTGADAELAAVTAGVHGELLRRVVDEKPTIKGNLLSRMAIMDGIFIILTKDSDGVLAWQAILGPGARQAGAEMAAGLWDSHKGPAENRKLELGDPPTS
jgi:hypothetical protein